MAVALLNGIMLVDLHVGQQPRTRNFSNWSGRSLLTEVETGREVATAVQEYTHGVMDSHLPNGTKLGEDWALQHPGDYMEVLQITIPQVLKEANVSAEDVIGIGIDWQQGIKGFFLLAAVALDIYNKNKAA
ncbi:hypothetical protein [Fictibacillus terranigra]|uniref:hypothetical protein n=1 Tax=Fictibacillus terranigra TaxID=3058424 RepID=UPI003CD0CA87